MKFSEKILPNQEENRKLYVDPDNLKKLTKYRSTILPIDNGCLIMTRKAG